MKYRNKPVVIDAVQWDGKADTANAILGDRYGFDWEYTYKESSSLTIPTNEGRKIAQVGDWIITGIKGEKYPCKPDIFDATYERVS